MAIKTLSKTPGLSDYLTFTAAAAGMNAGDICRIIEAGEWEEADAVAFTKSIEFVKDCEGSVRWKTVVGKNNISYNGGTAGSPLVCSLWGIELEIRKGGSNLAYNIHLAGGATVANTIACHNCVFISDYPVGTGIAIYQTAGKNHYLYECELRGTYENVVYAGSGKSLNSVIDGLTITNSTKYIMTGNDGAGTGMLDTWRWERVKGNVTIAFINNAGSPNQVKTLVSGLLTASAIWGLTGATTFGANPVGVTVQIENSHINGTGAYGFAIPAGGALGLKFRNVEFSGFSGQAVNQSGTGIADTIDYCGRSGGCPSFSNVAGIVGSHCQTNDPLLVDATNHDYHPTADSTRIDAGTTCIGTRDLDLVPIPQRAAPDIGCFEYIEELRVVSLTVDDKTLTVTLNDTPASGSFDTASAWDLETLDSLADDLEIDTLTTDGAIATIELVEAPTPGGAYRVTVPLDLANAGGHVIPEEDASIIGIMPITADPPPPRGILETLTLATGRRRAMLVGKPETCLLQDLAPADTIAYVESTLGFAAAGTARIGSEVVTYTSITGGTLRGLTRDPYVFNTVPMGTPVQDENRQWALRDQSWSEAGFSTAPDAFVDSIAADYDHKRPLSRMTTDDMRRYAQTMHYLDRGTWWSIFRVLRWMFKWSSQTGSTAVAYAAGEGQPVCWLDIPEGELAYAALSDRWIILQGTKLCRVITAYNDINPGFVTLLLESTDGPYWVAPELTDGQTDVEWELLAYMLEEAKWGEAGSGRRKPGYIRVSIFYQPTAVPATYLLQGGLAASQNRPERGIISENAQATGRHRFYLVQPYKRVTERVLKDVASAGVQVDVVSRANPA